MKRDLNCFVQIRFRLIARIQIQSFSGRFIFLHLSTLPRSNFPGSHGGKKHYPLVLFRARALQSFFLFFFHGVCKPCNEPETSGDWTLEYHKTAPLFITRFWYWTFCYLLYLLSLIGIFSRYLFVLTYFDSSRRRHTHATTHATGTQMIRLKMTSLDAIFYN